MPYTFSDELISDLHKDARGYRPSGDWMYNWFGCSSDQKEIIWNDLCDAMEFAMEEEAVAEKKASKNFEALILETISLGATDRETALRWILQSYKLTETDLMYGGSYICYLVGLSNEYEAELTMTTKELLNSMEAV